MSGLTISERLARFGVTHEGANQGGRYLRWQGESLGHAHADQAVTLLRLLESIAPPTPKEPDQ